MRVRELATLLSVVDQDCVVDITGSVLRCLAPDGKPVMEISVEDGRYRCASLLQMYVAMVQSAVDQTDNVAGIGTG